MNGKFHLYHSALNTLLQGGYGDMTVSPFTCTLLSASYIPDLQNQSHWSDIMGFEIEGGSYAPAAMSATDLIQDETLIGWGSHVIDFGPNATIPAAKYMAILAGTPSALENADPLLGYMDLNINGGTVMSKNAAFAIIPPKDGWFTISK